MTVARNTLYNLAGATVSLGTALVTVPLYLSRIGVPRYGVLSIVWVLLGYFGIFDLGLSRAASNKIARLRSAEAIDREEVFWTACLLNAALGIAGGALVYIAGTTILTHWYTIGNRFHLEVAAILPWVAAAIPVATVSAVLTGTLEGLERFRAVNIIQSAGTILFQVMPLLAAFLLRPNLNTIIPVAVVVRILTALPLAVAVKRAVPLTQQPQLRRTHIPDLFSYGAWVVLSNAVSPILSTFDRLLIGVTIGAADVSYYAVPFRLVNRLQFIPSALSRSLFPHLSSIDHEQSRHAAQEWTLTLAAIMTPLVVFGLLLVRPFLRVWLGITFAEHAAPVGEILLIGIWINSLAFVPFAFLQATGRPDVVAKFHVLELLPFLAILWVAVKHFGIVGAAAAWTLRVTIDALLLFFASLMHWKIAKHMSLGAALVVSTWLCVDLLQSITSDTRILLGIALATISCAWSLSSSMRLRKLLLRYIPSRLLGQDAP
jgi:O-antigen/teichoic acid export membrane protein